MKRIRLTLIIVLVGTLAFAQTSAKQELVSQRIANAISSGKFYMKLSNVVDPVKYMEEGERSMSEVAMTIRLAYRNGVSMTRFNTDMGTTLDNVSISADGYSYKLDEAKKTYTVQPVDAADVEFDTYGKLTFMRQGTCLLNGEKYHFDIWETASGHKLTFYYNSKSVTAIDLGVEEMGVMSLLEFDTHIPKDMYFCLTPEWKRSKTASSTSPDVKAMTGIDTDAMMRQAIQGIDVNDLPEGVDLNSIMGGGNIDMKKMLQQYVKPEDLPEGMSINDVMAMMGSQSDLMGQNGAVRQLEAMKKQRQQNAPQMREALRAQGYSESEIADLMGDYGDTSFFDDAIEDAKKSEKANQAAANAPDAPVCSSPWVDTGESNNLAAGNDLGAIQLGESTNTPRTDYVYIDDFDEAPTLVMRTDLNVTDDGVWLAFDDLSRQINEMSDEDAHQYILQVNSGMLSAMEAGYITGQMVEYAVATCMIDPHPINYNNTGMLFVKVGDNKRALDYFKKAEEMDRQNPAILTNIGECYLATGDGANARRYVDKALASNLTFGPALQLNTTLLLKEGKDMEAVEALFHCAAYYFSDITASQFCNLYMQLHALQAKADATNTTFKATVLDRIFSQKNQALLAQATKAGFNSNGQDKVENAKSFPFPYAPAAIQTTHASLEKMREGAIAVIEAQGKLVDEIMDRDSLQYDLYMSLGFGNMSGSLSGMESTLNQIPEIRGKVDLTSQLTDVVNQGYSLYNQAYNKGKSITLTDARQFWCLMMWTTYYKFLINWAHGYLADVKDDGTVVGDCPETFRRYHRILNANSNLIPVHSEDYSDCTTGCAKSGDEKAALYCLVDCGRSYYKAMSADIIANNTADMYHYTTSIQPILEEYWLRINAMTAYCDNLDMQEYFLTEAMYEINIAWLSPLEGGAKDGHKIENIYNAYVVNFARQAGMRIAEIERQEAEQLEAKKKKDVKLKNYGEKSRPDFGMGIPTPLGRISFMHSDGETTFSFQSAISDKTYSRNMTTGTNTTMTTYTTLADEQKKAPSFKEQVQSWISDKAQGKAKEGIIDIVGKAIFKMDGISEFMPSYEQGGSKQRARTVDAQGNVIDTYNVQQKSYTFGGGPVSATATQTLIRSGASLQTKNHVTFGFGGIDITIGK